MIYIESLDGCRYDLKSLGIVPLTFNVDSLSPVHETEVMEVMDGHVDIDTTFEGRTLSANFFIEAKDYYDYNQVRNQVFRLFNGKSYFYILDQKEPKKRWKVKTASKFTIDKNSLIAGSFSVEFISPSPYAESIGTTLDPFTFESEKWQVGQGLITDNLQYVHNKSSFKIFNAGDVSIDPRQMPLQIKYQGASSNLAIRNETTGDVWIYNGSTGVNDSIIIEGIRSIKNGQSIFGLTNRKLITLKSGWNDFTVIGASGSFLISFDFRFHYI